MLISVYEVSDSMAKKPMNKVIFPTVEPNFQVDNLVFFMRKICMNKIGRNAFGNLWNEKKLLEK
jgi:hypothetical protein